MFTERSLEVRIDGKRNVEGSWFSETWNGENLMVVVVILVYLAVKKSSTGGQC